MTGEMANTANGQPKFPISINQYGLFFLILIVAQGIISFFRTIAFTIVSEKGMADLRKQVFNKLITQDINFIEQSRVGELTSSITTDVEKLQNTFAITLAEFLRQIVILVIGVFVLAWLTPGLSLIMWLTFPVVVVSAFFFARYIRKLSRQRQDELAKSNTIIEEAMTSFAVVKSFANEWYESIRYAGSVKKVVQISLKFARVRGLFFIFVITLLFGGIFFILWRGALMVEAGDMAVGDLFSFIMYTGVIGGAIAGIGNLYTQIMTAVGASERVLDILERDSEVELNDEINSEKEKINGQIELKDVKFAYPSRPDVIVLDGINLAVAKGEKVALVGQSGSGKSTLAKLLLKFYQPDTGHIFVDDKKLTSFDTVAYRKQAAYVPQEVLLFGGTIKENILYGRPDATEEEVRHAAAQANALEFIDRLPEGMNTIVGDRGIKLSGGQRQRVAIARAILRDPAILILDEATSSLDAESEAKVQEALDRLMEGRTSVVIAHRLATIRNVDCIYVLENGQVVESGHHEELMQNRHGVYSQLAKLQFELV